jgi:hypothetical protein
MCKRLLDSPEAGTGGRQLALPRSRTAKKFRISVWLPAFTSVRQLKLLQLGRPNNKRV